MLRNVPASSGHSKTAPRKPTKTITKKPTFSKRKLTPKSLKKHFSTTAPLVDAATTTTTSPVDTTTTSNTTNKKNTPSPVSQIMLYLSDTDFFSFNRRRNTNYQIAAPELGIRVYPVNNDYTSSIPQTMIPTNKTVAHVCGELQSLFPIKPVFISLSTPDTKYARYYFNHEPPHRAMRSQYGTKMDIIDEAVKSQLGNPDASGIPPVHFQMSKFKTPATTIPFFNNPNHVLTSFNPLDPSNVEVTIENTKSSFKKTLQTIFIPPEENPKKTKDGSELTQQMPPHHTPNAANHALHPITPLYDISQAAGLYAHVTYTVDQIQNSPELSKFVQENPTKWVEMYPTLAGKGPKEQYRTMKYQITPGGGLLETNYEDKSPVSPKILLGLIATYFLTFIGLEVYEHFNLQQAQLINPGVDPQLLKSSTVILTGPGSNPMDQFSDLQRHKQRLVGQVKIYDMDLQESTTLSTRWAAYKDNAIGWNDVVNPWFQLPKTYVDMKQSQSMEGVHGVENVNGGEALPQQEQPQEQQQNISKDPKH